MTCAEFKASLPAGTLSDGALTHLRSCEECLTTAVDHDPDLMFRALGGEMEPPGGTEAFAAEVMQQIHVRETERRFTHREGRLPAAHRWALAAAAAMMFVTGTLFWPRDARVEAPVRVATVQQPVAVASPAAIRPVVEKWDSPTAMIIEIPEEETSDLKVVMVFDESLPADI